WIAGRSVRCLKCMTAIVVPSAPSAPVSAAPPAPALPIADPGSSEVGLRPTSWLTALLLTGIGVASFLVVALLVIVFTRQTPASIVETPQGTPDPGNPGSVTYEPVAPAPDAKPQLQVKLPLADRAERLAAIEAEEKETLDALQKQADKHQSALQKLRKDE